MDIKPRVVGDYVPEDRSWLASQDGTQNPASGVIAVPLFTKATHYPNGVIKSGTLLVKTTSGPHAGKYGPYDAAATDGRQNAAGAKHLFNSTAVDPKSTAVYIGVPLQRRGFIRRANLPTGHGVTSAAETALRGVFSYE